MKALTPDELGSIFSHALTEVISKISSYSLDVLSTEKDAAFNENVAVMSLNSNKSGMLFLSAEEPDMRALCSCMTGVPEDEVSVEDIWDALCELVNMTAGNAKVQLFDTDHMFSLSSPFIITGKDISIISKKRSTVISRSLGNDEISIKMKIAY